jgi:hypothetical protein
METNKFVLNYNNKKLYLLFDGEQHEFDLTNAELEDHWDSFVHNGARVKDINLWFEDNSPVPHLAIYDVVDGNTQTQNFVTVDEYLILGEHPIF